MFVDSWQIFVANKLTRNNREGAIVVNKRLNRTKRERGIDDKSRRERERGDDDRERGDEIERERECEHFFSLSG